MKTVTLTIDGKVIKARAGEKLLWAALENGIYIPNLCAIREREEPDASCRLCWVEVEGQSDPVPACAIGVQEGMAVSTKGEKALALARAAFELLMASHALDCAHCQANGRCELQKIAKVLKCSLKPKRLRLLLRDLPVDDSSPLFSYDPNKCVLCGRCVWECRKHREKAIMGFAHRGFERRLTTFADEPIGADRCLDCSECVKVCPTGALTLK
ncbi:MAG: 2Fe-2S iron-sulfur cluster-binding protein [Dehalococcoidales bacterium]|jgi:formate dehydrogenase major subunit/NADH-quinone oxidoreductase subunit G